MAEQYNLPVYTAAFRVINDIKDYNKSGGLKKQLAALCAQVQCSERSLLTSKSTMVALVKLKSYGITEDHILHLKG